MIGNQPAIVYAILLGFTVLSQAGCAPQTRIATPVESPDAFSDSGTQQVPDKWWLTFDDENLNTVVATALKSNFNLRTAWQRLMEARAVADRESSALLPILEGTVQGRTEPAGSEPRESDDLQLGLSSVYEVDLWGRIGSAVEAEQYRAVATLADFQTAALSVSAEIVRTWYQLAEAQSQLNLAEEQIETNEKVLNLIENRLGTGQVQGVDILRQRQLLESTREQRAYVESNLQVLKHQLAVLLGRSPREKIAAIPDHLPELPPLPETGVPVDLVQRRPDVRNAFFQLRAADRDLASAISSQYPRLTLSASLTTSADNAAAVFRDWVLSFAGNLLVPLFYGGELSAEVDRAEAARQQRLYEYGQATLTAFQEVEDALTLEMKQNQAIRHLEQQVELATQAYEQLQIQYLNGTVNYLDVLTSLSEVQQLRRNLLSARLALIEYRIALYRALAGSFEAPMENEE